MILDLSQGSVPSEINADVCIIGGGAAGITIASELLDAGADVVVLESGGIRSSPETERLNQGEAEGLDPASLIEGRSRVLGGATALWAGQCLPAPAETFSQRHWIPHAGWPFGLAELDPFYRRAEEKLRIEGEAYDERVWDRFGVERPATDGDRVVHRFTVWCPRPHLGRLYRRALSESSAVRVFLHATATELVTNSAGDQFTSVRVATPQGTAVQVRARACVLCGGGIENARLLLASTGADSRGIGNRHDVVGRYFQDHPNGHVAQIVDGDVARLQELYGLFYQRRVRYLPRAVLSPAAQAREQVLSCAAYPVFHFGDDTGIEAARRMFRSLRKRRLPPGVLDDSRLIARDLPRLASITRRRVWHRRSAGLKPAAVTLQAHVEQTPDPDSRVTLSAKRDALGVPLPVVTWKMSELDRRTTAVMVDVIHEEFRRLGLGNVRPSPWLAQTDWRQGLRDSYHHIGTTRLGEDPETSVANPNSEIHDVQGLFVAGSSVFPVAGYINPTLTIVALAIRLTEHVRAVLENA